MVDEEIRDAGEAGTEHAAIATLIAASPRWGERARDRATSWRGALDDPGQSEAGGGGRAGMAAGRRRHRRGAGSSIVWAGRGHAGPAAAGRAGLGGPGARAQASWRHDDDPLGGIPGGPSRGLRLQPLCCGPAYVAEPSERAGLPGMNRNISSSGGVGDYRAFRNVISEGSGRCHGLVCTPDISTRASAFAFISMSTSA